jgi:hypothetical protein
VAADNTAAEARNRRARLGAELKEEVLTVAPGEANKAALNLNPGWDWGKWTCDLCSVEYQLYDCLDGRPQPPVSVVT